MKTEQEVLATDFLLGKLTEEEQIEIEKEYFHNTKLFENILSAENDLIDAYVTGGLSPEEHTRFENRLLLNPRQRQRVNFARTLIKYASVLLIEDANAPKTKSSWMSVISFLTSNKPLLSLSFAATALIFIVGAIWLNQDQRSPETSQTNEITVTTETPQPVSPIQATTVLTDNGNEVTTEAEKEAEPPLRKPVQNNRNQATPEKQAQKPPRAIFSIALSPGLTRAAGKSQEFAIPAKTDFVKIRLNLGEARYASYQAVLETVEGNQVWTSSRLKNKNDGKSISILIPSKLLKKADYILSLKGLKEDGVYERVEDYPFTISP